MCSSDLRLYRWQAEGRRGDYREVLIQAMQEVGPGKRQRVRIELEYLSRNFVAHGHKADECDVIVCWIHNWPECPENLQVIELSKVVKRL